MIEIRIAILEDGEEKAHATSLGLESAGEELGKLGLWLEKNSGVCLLCGEITIQKHNFTESEDDLARSEYCHDNCREHLQEKTA